MQKQRLREWPRAALAEFGLMRRVSANSLHLFVRTVLVAAAGIVSVGMVLDALGIESYGLYVTVSCLATAFHRVEGILRSTACRYIGCEMGYRAGGDVNGVWSAVLAFCLLVAVAVIVLGSLAGGWILRTCLDVPSDRFLAASFVLHAALAGVACRIVQVAFSALVVMEERMSCFSIAGVLEAALSVGSAWAVGRMADGRLTAYAVLLVGSAVLILVFYVAYCRRCFPRVRFSRGRGFSKLPEIVRFFFLRTLTGLGNAVKIDGVTLLVNALAGLSMSATWGVATQVRLVFHSVSDSFQQACTPTVYKRMAGGDVEGVRRFVWLETLLSLLLVAVPVLIWLAFGERLMLLWIEGPRPVELAPLCVCAMLWVAVDVTAGPLSVVILASGRIALFKLAMLLFACLGFAGAWLALSRGAPLWMAMAAVVAANALSILYRIAHIRLSGMLNREEGK